MMRLFLFSILLLSFGCAHRDHHDEKGHQCTAGCMHHHESGKDGKMSCEMAMSPSPSTGLTAGEAKILPLGKSKIKGDVTFASVGEDLKVTVKIGGLRPNQKQGFHIHEFGNCAAKDGSSAGGHFNPGKKTHSGTVGDDRHMGDLGNLTADAKGNVETEIIAPKTSLRDILGRAVVVHDKEDDLKTQPSGASGDRVACGVIGLTQ